MKNIITALTGVALALGLSACGTGETAEPATSSSEVTTTTSEKTTTSTTVTTTTSSEKITTSSETTTEPVVEEPVTGESVVQETYTEPALAPVVEDTHVVPERPVFMRPEDWDPYGPPRFIECWEPNAAVMSDGSIVTDTVNCLNTDPAWGIGVPEVETYVNEPPHSDGCVGPAAVCGYYDEYGNPIWFDKQTGETSPRYYDEYGNPTMESPY